MNLHFNLVSPNEFEDFKKDVKEIFSIAVINYFGMPSDGEIIPDKDIYESLYNSKAVVFYIYLNNKRIGGVVLI